MMASPLRCVPDEDQNCYVADGSVGCSKDDDTGSDDASSEYAPKCASIRKCCHPTAKRKRSSQNDRNVDINAKKPRLLPYHQDLGNATEIHEGFLNQLQHIAPAAYLSHWTEKEAVRELVANLLDQSRCVAKRDHLDSELQITEEPGRLAVHVQDNLLAEITWKERTHKYVYYYVAREGKKYKGVPAEKPVGVSTVVLELTNYASRIPYDAFWIGESTKKNSKDVIGTHGEGLSAACVVLSRHECNMTVSWKKYVATIVGLQDAVWFQISTGRGKPAAEEVVKVRIAFPPPGNLQDVEDIIASVRVPSTAPKVSCQRGELLTTPAHKGMQFNRSIFVCEDPKAQFGYNFFDPDKNLLQGRDRNSHTVDACLRECGSILSEAILQSDEVCQRVLQCLVYTGAPGAGGYRPCTYRDLGNGEHLSEAAVQHLRNAQTALSGREEAIFCAADTTLLVQLSAQMDLPIVYSHPALHNYSQVIARFHQHMEEGAKDLPEGSAIVAHQREICELMCVELLRMSTVEIGNGLLGFWRVGSVAFVTGYSEQAGLTPESEVNVHESLRACDVDLRAIIQVVRLLQDEHLRSKADNPEEPSEPPDLDEGEAQRRDEDAAPGDDASVSVSSQPVGEDQAGDSAEGSAGVAVDGDSGPEDVDGDSSSDYEPTRRRRKSHRRRTAKADSVSPAPRTSEGNTPAADKTADAENAVPSVPACTEAVQQDPALVDDSAAGVVAGDDGATDDGGDGASNCEPSYRRHRPRRRTTKRARTTAAPGTSKPTTAEVSTQTSVHPDEDMAVD
jgi:hypothetical protein